MSTLEPNFLKIYGSNPNLHSTIIITPVKEIYKIIVGHCKCQSDVSKNSWYFFRNISYKGIDLSVIHAGPYSQPMIDCLNFLNEKTKNISRVFFCGFAGVVGNLEEIGSIVNPDVSVFYSSGAEIQLNKEMDYQHCSRSKCISFETLYQEQIALSQRVDISKQTYIDLELFSVANWATLRGLSVHALLGITDDVCESPLWVSDKPISLEFVQRLAIDCLEHSKK